MRIATGGVSHESSTFAECFTTFSDFETGKGLFRGEQVIERFRGTNICTGGFIDEARQQGFELLPLLWTFAYPSGVVKREGYDRLKAEFVDRLRKVETDGGPVDGILLDMHGAMVIEGIDDGDGDFIATVREVVGKDRPIAVTQDLHGNHTRQRVALADMLIGFDTYPHVDMAERGREAARLVAATVRGEIRPVMRMVQLPLLWSAECQVTAHAPMDEAMRLVHEIEERPGILSVTLATGFPWADVPEVGASVIVVADEDQALAQKTAEEIGTWIWERRERWYRKPMSAREALTEGERAGKYPIILADQADNTGGGAPGDSTEVLQTFLDLGLEDALVLYMVDPLVAKQAQASGVGSRIEVVVGGKSDPVQGPPVETAAEVVAISDGAFAYDGPMFAGLTGDMGPSAWLRHKGVSMVVVTSREQPFDQAFARSLGINCSAMRYIAVKSAAHFRSGFEQIAGSIYNINARAIHSHDFTQMVYRNCNRPLYPIQDTNERLA